MKRSTTWLRLGVIVLSHAIVVLASRTACLATDAGEPAPGDEKPCTFEAALPVWIPGNFGTLTIRDHVSHLDVSPGDTMDLLTSGHAFAGEGYFDLRYDRFFTFVDAFGGYVDESVSENVPIRRFPRLGHVAIDAKAKLKQVLVDVGFGYRLGQWAMPSRRRPFTLDLYAGARSYWFLTRVRAAATGPRGRQAAADVSRTFEWADPMVGVRWEVPLLDCLSADFRGDIGGFDAGSDIAWNLVGGFRYWVSTTILSAHPYVAVGYRALDFDRSEGADNEIDLQIRGPFGSLGLVF
jgi:hypothetical protein